MFNGGNYNDRYGRNGVRNDSDFALEEVVTSQYLDVQYLKIALNIIAKLNNSRGSDINGVIVGRIHNKVQEVLRCFSKMENQLVNVARAQNINLNNVQGNNLQQPGSDYLRSNDFAKLNNDNVSGYMNRYASANGQYNAGGNTYSGFLGQQRLQNQYIEQQRQMVEQQRLALQQQMNEQKIQNQIQQMAEQQRQFMQQQLLLQQQQVAANQRISNIQPTGFNQPNMMPQQTQYQGIQSPQPNMQQPPMQSQQPMMQSQQPMMQSQQPMMQSQQPMMQPQQSSMPQMPQQPQYVNVSPPLQEPVKPQYVPDPTPVQAAEPAIQSAPPQPIVAEAAPAPAPTPVPPAQEANSSYKPPKQTEVIERREPQSPSKSKSSGSKQPVNPFAASLMGDSNVPSGEGAGRDYLLSLLKK